MASSSTSTNNLASKVNDIRRLADEKKNLGVSKKSSSGSPHKNGNTLISSNNLDRSIGRADLSNLENELEERVRLVLESASFKRTNDAFGADFSYQPHKEAMLTTRERMLAEFGANVEDLENEPWLDSYMKCECLKVLCDEVSIKFSDILSVSSTEMGNLARKLRLTYRQSFEQMARSWQTMRLSMKRIETEAKLLTSQNQTLQISLDNKEDELSHKFDSDLARLTAEFQQDKERDNEKLMAAEFKMDQMSDTLKYLNGIFRSMQNDGNAMKTADLHTLCARLEKENKELRLVNSDFENVRVQLAATQNKVKALEAKIKSAEDEQQRLNTQLSRREEVINNLMEREAIRSAEVEKLQKMSKLKDDELLSMDLKDPATSVLCIKCKRSLDDLSNIRAALTGDGAADKMRQQCENFRILLPNLRGRKPNRTVPWIKGCMRSILVGKMKEHVSLHVLRADQPAFPAYVYSWFCRSTEGIVGSSLNKLLVQCDEDRWGFYYGIKARNKDDAECQFFWSLLDETFGQDGLHFALHCLSVVLSIAGTQLWRQFGSALKSSGSIESSPVDEAINAKENIWLDVRVAKEAIQMILKKALQPHVIAAMDAIEALKALPADLAADIDQLQEDILTAPEQDCEAISAAAEAVAKSNGLQEEVQYVNLFVWLRVMMQQLHADKIHRGAAIRLMFETASVGALTASVPNGSSAGVASNPTGGQHVEYPQFQSICQTLFPNISVSEIAMFYASCHRIGKHKVTAELFSTEADQRGLFSQAMKLTVLPLLKNIHFRDIGNLDQEQNELEQPLTYEEKIALRSENSTKLLNVAGINQIFFTKKTRLTVRSKLAIIIHRKVASMTPAIKRFMDKLPQRWRVLVKDSLESVTNSLNDTYERLRQIEVEAATMAMNAITGGATAPISSDHLSRALFLDGLQPYLCYRRLMAVISLASAANENPLLPMEIFGAAELCNSEEGISRAIFRAESVLTSLEHSFLLPFDANPASTEKRYAVKYRRFEHIRRVVVARKVQQCYRRFLSREVVIPRPVRMVMAAGYLMNNRKDPSMPSLAPLRAREVTYEPWWGAARVAEIYLFKMRYDAKASCLGLEPVPLAQSVPSYFYYLTGSTEIAERSIQDFFQCVRAYRHGVPRMRLFAAFLGDDRDMEASVLDILRTPQAITVYFDMIFCVHRQYLLVIAEQEAAQRDDTLASATLPPSSIIELLFPSTESHSTRTDKRDLWLLSADILAKVARRWTNQQPWLAGNEKLFVDLPEKLRADGQGRVDVDDFLWLVMQQWAKLQVWHVKRSDTRGGIVNTAFPSLSSNRGGQKEPEPESSGLSRPGSSLSKKRAPSSDSASIDDSKNKPILARRLSLMPLSNLKSIVDSVYRTGEAKSMADPVHYAVSYIRCIRGRRATLFRDSNNASLNENNSERIKKLGLRLTTELQRLLRECVLWDTNLGIFHLLPGLEYTPKRAEGSTSSYSSVTVRSATLAQGASVVTSKASAPSNSSPSDLSDLIPPLDCGSVVAAVAPELQVVSSKLLFSAYQSCITSFLNKLTDDPKFAEESEVQQRAQALRILLMAAADFFGRLEIDFPSHKLFGLKLLGCSPEDLIELESKRSILASLAREAQAQIKSLISNVGELTVLIQQDFPRDPWLSGAKVHVDKAVVYTINTKNLAA